MTWRLAWFWSGPLALAAWLALAHSSAPGEGPLACPIRALIGMPCPGCGMTRALLALGRGDWGAALSWHPLAPLVVLEAVGLWFLAGRLVARGERPSSAAWGLALALHAGVFLLVWAARAATDSLPW